MPLGIDPTVDYAFKKLFAVPENKDLLIHLLNAVLPDQSPIVDAEILSPFNEKDFADDKLSVLDIKARGSDGALYNIEIQNRAEPSIRQRLAYYGAELYTKQLAEGEDYGTLLPAITICFLSEKLFRGTSNPHSRFTLCDPRQQLELTAQLQIHTIELAKYNFQGVALDRADTLMQWAFFLANAAEMEADSLKQVLPGREFAKATGVVEMIAQSPEERQQYLSRLKAERDHRWRLKMAEEQGLEQGLEQGRREGLAGRIRMLQRILKLPETAEEELMAMELVNLSELSYKLEGDLRRGSA